MFYIKVSPRQVLARVIAHPRSETTKCARALEEKGSGESNIEVLSPTSQFNVILTFNVSP